MSVGQSNLRDRLKTQDGQKRTKLQIMGLGGFGVAHQRTGISYARLSRIINGWIKPSEDELRRIQEFINGRAG